MILQETKPSMKMYECARRIHKWCCAWQLPRFDVLNTAEKKTHQVRSLLEIALEAFNACRHRRIWEL